MRQGLQAPKTEWITLLVVGVYLAVPTAATCGYWVARWGKTSSLHRPSDPMHWAYVSVGWGFVASILLGVVLFVVCLIRGVTSVKMGKPKRE